MPPQDEEMWGLPDGAPDEAANEDWEDEIPTVKSS